MSIILALRLFLAILHGLPQDYPQERALVAAFDIAAVTQDPGQMATLAVLGYQESKYSAVRHKSGKVCGIVQVKHRSLEDCALMLSDNRYAFARGLEMLKAASAHCRNLGRRNGRCIIAAYAGGPRYMDTPRTAGYAARSMPRINSLVEALR